MLVDTANVRRKEGNMRRKEMEQRIHDLEAWLINVSEIQDQLLKELNYEIKYKQPWKKEVYLEKIKEENKNGN